MAAGRGAQGARSVLFGVRLPIRAGCSPDGVGGASGDSRHGPRRELRVVGVRGAQITVRAVHLGDAGQEPGCGQVDHGLVSIGGSGTSSAKGRRRRPQTVGLVAEESFPVPCDRAGPAEVGRSRTRTFRGGGRGREDRGCEPNQTARGS